MLKPTKWKTTQETPCISSTFIFLDVSVRGSQVGEAAVNKSPTEHVAKFGKIGEAATYHLNEKAKGKQPVAPGIDPEADEGDSSDSTWAATTAIPMLG